MLPKAVGLRRWVLPERAGQILPLLDVGRLRYCSIRKVPLIHDRPVSEDKAPVLPIQPVWVHLRQSEFPFLQCSEPQRGIRSGGREKGSETASCTAAQPSEQESTLHSSIVRKLEARCC